MAAPLIAAVRKSDDPAWHIRRRIQRVWCQMISRCSNPKERNYPRYGGRGISIDHRWLSFEAFYEWALANGYTAGMSIERNDNDGHYCPENCRWIPLRRQQRNTMRSHFIEFAGKRQTIAEWAEELGMSVDAIEARLRVLNWTPEKALTTPVRRAGEKRKRTSPHVSA